MVEITPAQVIAVAEQLIQIGADQPHEVYVSALLHVIRCCGDNLPFIREELGQNLLHIGGRLIAESPAIRASSLAAMPAPTSIH